MSKEHVDEEEARARLTAEHGRVSEMVGRLREEFGSSESEQVGELASYDQHPGDLGSETFEREKDLSILEGLEADLSELEAALQRIDDGTYGIDEVTGEPIDPDRLRANPAARTNIDPREREGRGRP